MSLFFSQIVRAGGKNKFSRGNKGLFIKYICLHSVAVGFESPSLLSLHFFYQWEFVMNWLQFLQVFPFRHFSAETQFIWMVLAFKFIWYYILVPVLWRIAMSFCTFRKILVAWAETIGATVYGIVWGKLSKYDGRDRERELWLGTCGSDMFISAQLCNIATQYSNTDWQFAT